MKKKKKKDIKKKIEINPRKDLKERKKNGFNV